MVVVCKIRGCTVDDAAPLARNNMPAFWTDMNWRLNWTGWELEQIIAECTKRMPQNLLKDRAALRHEMAVDGAGNTLGYARWVLPKRLAGNKIWGSAQTLAVDAASEKEYAKLFNSARWATGSSAMALGDPMAAAMERLMKDKDYIGWYMIQPQFCSETFDGYQKILSNFFFLFRKNNLSCVSLLLMDILELEYLAVHPDNQGRGVATRLVEHGIAEANKLGIDIIVMAYKAAVGVYKRLGFETVETLLQDDSQYGGDGEFSVYYMVFKVSK